MIQARPEVSLLELELLVSGGEESREELWEEFGEGVRSVCNRLRLWRGRWMVIARCLGDLKRLKCREGERVMSEAGRRGVENERCSRLGHDCGTYMCIHI